MRHASLLSISTSLLLTLGGCSFGAPSAPHAPQPSTAASAGTGEHRPADTSDTPADLVITDRIRTLFVEDSELAQVQSHVLIATAAHEVTLTGSVATDRQRLVMAAHARATEGVSHLDNQIALAP